MGLIKTHTTGLKIHIKKKIDYPTYQYGKMNFSPVRRGRCTQNYYYSTQGNTKSWPQLLIEHFKNRWRYLLKKKTETLLGPLPANAILFSASSNIAFFYASYPLCHVLVTSLFEHKPMIYTYNYLCLYMSSLFQLRIIFSCKLIRRQ
jgi:hypothetical protein